MEPLAAESGADGECVVLPEYSERPLSMGLNVRSGSKAAVPTTAKRHRSPAV
jgi:hypothetical protein